MEPRKDISSDNTMRHQYTHETSFHCRIQAIIAALLNGQMTAAALNESKLSKDNILHSVDNNE